MTTLQRRTGTGPRPDFETHIEPPSFYAMLLLDNQAEFCEDPNYLIRELKFNLGLEQKEAEAAYNNWQKVRAKK